MCRCEPGAAPLKVAVLLSGGVDSSLALHLLKAAGHNVTAFYLKIWFQDDFKNFWSQCPWEEDLQYCQQVGRGMYLAAVAPDQAAKLLVHAKLAATPQCAGDQMQSRCACAHWASRPTVRTVGSWPSLPDRSSCQCEVPEAECPRCPVQVCDAAGVPLEVVPLTEQYWDRVVAHSISEIRAGRTPNPDVLCNSRCGG